ncbi:hypothetical protein ABH995_000628 [Bradyrhizobium yuanmingense]
MHHHNWAGGAICRAEPADPLSVAQQTPRRGAKLKQQAGAEPTMVWGVNGARAFPVVARQIVRGKRARTRLGLCSPGIGHTRHALSRSRTAQIAPDALHVATPEEMHSAHDGHILFSKPDRARAACGGSLGPDRRGWPIRSTSGYRSSARGVARRGHVQRQLGASVMQRTMYSIKANQLELLPPIRVLYWQSTLSGTKPNQSRQTRSSTLCGMVRLSWR